MKFSRIQQKAIDNHIEYLEKGNIGFVAIDHLNRPVISGSGFYALTKKGVRTTPIFPLKDYVWKK